MEADDITSQTANEVWELCNQKLKDDCMSVRGIIKKSNVCFIGTTDDPIDSLEYHKLLAEDKSFDTIVAPSFRPDKALNIDKDGWANYIEKLSQVSGVNITDLQSLKQSLTNRIDYFASHGCRASDHGLDFMIYATANESELNTLIARGLNGEKIDSDTAEPLKTDFYYTALKNMLNVVG